MEDWPLSASRLAEHMPRLDDALRRISGAALGVDPPQQAEKIDVVVEVDETQRTSRMRASSAALSGTPACS